MLEAYNRNNIYFLLEKSEYEYLYLLILEKGNLYEYFSNCLVGTKDDLFGNQDIIVAPIDILLYHVPNLEYLNRHYTLKEQNLLKDKKMEPNIWRRAKYNYTEDEINLMYLEMQKIKPEYLKALMQRYSSYFKNRKDDPILRIYTL